VLPLEVIAGKLVPYIAIGLVQSSIILAAARYVFDVPFVGSLVALYVAALLFIAANLTVGITLSSIAQNQLQAMQLTIFYFLPSLLLSGFMFPFAGMPKVAQWLAEVLPLTHFLRLIRGVMLRGARLGEMWIDVLALAAFVLVAMTVAIARFRKRLD
jgi:ABC-2 type transport system permease protein